MKALIIIATLVAAQVAMACGAQSNARMNANTSAKRIAQNAPAADANKATGQSGNR